MTRNLSASPTRSQRRHSSFVLALAILAAALMLTWRPASARGEQAEARSAPGRRIIVTADPANRFHYVPPDMPPLMAADGTSASTFLVTYGPGFAAFPEAQTAFQHAVNIAQSLVRSPVPITVEAEFEDLGPRVLGSAGAGNYWTNFSGAPVPDTFYPNAMANKFRGSDIDPDVPEVEAAFSSSFDSWYFGVDGQPPAGQYDFVTVVLHELWHGLGFAGSMDVSDGSGSWGDGGRPIIYDRFAVNGFGTSLIDTAFFPNPSTQLAAQLTSGSVFWNGTTARSANDGSLPPLYAPSPWEQGSSFSHLAESFNNTVNALMTHSLGAAEALHSPGAVGRAVLSDMGWDVGCPYSPSASSTTPAASGASGIFSIVTSPGCFWVATSSVPWITFGPGNSGTGTSSVSFTVAANTGASARSGTITAGGMPVTITQAGSGRTLAWSRTTLFFGATTTSGVSTPAQPITLSTTDAGLSWTLGVLGDNCGFLQVDPAAGAGTSILSARVAAASYPPGRTTCTLRATSAGAGNSPQDVAVTLDVYAAGASGAPFGNLDTPVNNATNVVGSTAVTGWVLDDVGTSEVSIFRNCLSIDNPASCQAVDGLSVVFIGHAAFVEGARPDVAAAFPDRPLADRGGWGYLMLTNMLPHVTAPENPAAGGQGPITIYAFATDVEGQRSLIGQAAITLDNDNAEKPFGAIDTPAQGETVSGTIANFGWALTPGTAQIPSENAVIAFIDAGTPNQIVVPVTYNQCRGTVGNPAPAGTCNDDVATLFPHFTNITNAGGAIGSFVIDTTQLSNGFHTIAWSVTDDQGRVEGIGSRFFIVQNGTGSDLVSTR